MRTILLLSLTLLLLSCNQQKEQLLPQADDAKGSIPTEYAEDPIDLSIIMGKFDPAAHESFVLIEKEFADREGLYLQEETYASFKKMNQAAEAEGIKLTIRSATRNFDYQRGIWERKWAANIKNEKEIDEKTNALKILKYSSMPSTSRHHWGTDIDFNSFENSWFETGEGLKLYTWMSEHASTYGFCQVYSEKDETRPHGYNEEKWHWSYLPIASKYFEIANSHMNDEMITGFEGSDVAEEIGVVDKYILGINKNCK